MKKKLFPLAFLLSGVCAAQTLTIDLSKNLNKTFSQTIDPMVLKQIVLTNKILLSGVTYTVEIKREKIPAQAIDGSGFLAPSGGSCTNLNTAQDNLTKEKSEIEIPNHIVKLQEEIDKATKASICPTDVTNSKKSIQATIEYINLLVPLEISEGEKVTITVTKDKDNKWTYIFSTSTESPWSIMYGFSFVPNELNPVTTYYSRAESTPNTYTIIRQNNQRKDYLTNVSPTFLLQWRPLKKHSFKDTRGKGWTILSNSFYQFGMATVLSLNFAKETGGVNLGVGPSIVFADNVSVSFGLGATPKSVLKGQYSENQTIKESLDFDQLHEKRYLAEWFFTLGIRFNQNPFAKAEEKK